MFDKTIVNKSSDNLYTVLNDELKRMHILLTNSMHGTSNSNTNIFWSKIDEIQTILMQQAKAGLDESLQAKVEELQKHAAEQILLGK